MDEKDLRKSTSGAEPIPETVPAVYGEAEEVVRRLLQRLPDSPDCLETMSRLLLSMGRSSEAERHWKRVLEINPQYAYAYDGLAEVAAKRGDLEESATLYRKSLQIAPASARTLLELSRVLVRLERPEEAVATLRKHLAVDPRSMDGLLLLGETLLRKQDYPGAKQVYLKATQIEPGRPHAWYGLGTACQRLNQPEEGRQFLEKSFRLRAEASKTDDIAAIFSDVRIARWEVAKIYTDVARIRASLGDRVEAERLWRRAARFDQRNPDPRSQLASFYIQSGRKSEAVELARELAGMSLEPRHYLNLAVLFARLDLPGESEKLLARCRELAPREGWPYLESARFYLQVARRPSEALPLARKAVELEPSAPDYGILGEACRLTGDREGARAAFRKAQELDPAGKVYAESLRRLGAAP